MTQWAEERIWCIRRYPDGELLHTELSYKACDTWQQENNPLTFITPAFFRSDVNVDTP